MIGNNWISRDSAVSWHPYTQMKSADEVLPVDKAEGIYIYDTSGNKYIDAVSSWWTNIHGHCHPYMIEKVTEQLKSLGHVMFAGITHPPAIILAERLLNKIGHDHSRIFYSDDGSTAVEVAIKMALQYWRNKGTPRNKIIALKNAYHGDTFGAMSVSERGVFTKPFYDQLFETVFIEAPVRGNEEVCLLQLKNILGEAGVAAFIYEPMVQGAGGMIVHDAGSLKKMILMCQKAGVITIADEVMTGFYRTGKLFASEHFGVFADLICLSKGLTGGLFPMGVTSARSFIFDAFYDDDRAKAFFHGHSYTANPVACAAALASLDLTEEKGFVENVEKISELNLAFVEKLKLHPKVENPRTLGTILAFEVKTVKNDGYLSEVNRGVFRYFLSKGIVLRPLGNVLYIMPPYCIKTEELEYIYENILSYLSDL